MKRLLVVSNMYPSPATPYFGVFVERQVRAIRAHGVAVDLAVSAARGGSALAAARKYAALTATAVARAGRKPEAILAHFAYPTGAIALAARAGRAKRAPVALVAHGGDVNPERRQSRAVARATRRVLRDVDLLVAVSRAIRERVVSLGASPDRIVVASMGYDETLFAPGDRDAARKALGLDPEGRYGVLVGNLIPRKGIGELIRAAARLRDTGLRWIVCGDGDAARWRAEATRAGAADLISFEGAVAPRDVPLRLAAADLAVVPSLREALGVAALEAMACGVPVVASRTGGLAEIVEHERAGLLVEPGDDAALAQAVRRIAVNDALRESMSREGPIVAAPHSASRQARIVLDAIEDAISRRSSRT